ncbi:hypothetical protein [Bradyrhizobium canariense]|uniref:DUF3617 domain-containing protein n=1 Tax=Bradyrhizobium canariense TaxID=255045 RepID=A0A1H1MAE3_9BRAD|nr:hypothetical protein [Bradyrhizobium canariense]SDR83726.1 hypothetical protein SAMN05444158_0155 [Bradyrhizobium canariense]
MAHHSFDVLQRELALAIGICAAASATSAQTYSASGQIGYLQEWEMKASLAKTMTATGASYDGPVTLRHVGLCSVNGVEEKSGTVQLKVSPKTSGIEGTLAMQDDNCHIVASAAQSYSGLLSCRDGQGIPIKFSIELMQIADQHDPANGK